jgi:hypothetical protein
MLPEKPGNRRLKLIVASEAYRMNATSRTAKAELL